MQDFDTLAAEQRAKLVAITICGPQSITDMLMNTLNTRWRIEAAGYLGLQPRKKSDQRELGNCSEGEKRTQSGYVCIS